MRIPNTKTVLEAAVALRTSQSRVLEMIGSKQLPAVNVGKGKLRPRWAIRDEDLNALLPCSTSDQPRGIPSHV